jgi:predicted RNase H-like HicB family nuclease
MDATRRLTAIITREGDGYVALCPELDIASQGASVEQARANLTEALSLFFECASPAEVGERLSRETYISSIELPLSA